MISTQDFKTITQARLLRSLSTEKIPVGIGYLTQQFLNETTTRQGIITLFRDCLDSLIGKGAVSVDGAGKYQLSAIGVSMLSRAGELDA